VFGHVCISMWLGCIFAPNFVLHFLPFLLTPLPHEALTGKFSSDLGYESLYQKNRVPGFGKWHHSLSKVKTV